MKQVVVIGSLNYDIFLTLSQMPKIGETASASSASSCAGGKGANQAVQIAKLGIPVSMIGRVGKDQMGNVLINSLTEAGVDIGGLKRTETAETGMGVVHVFPDGSVMAVISRGANYAITAADILQEEERIKKADLMVLQLEIPLEAVETAVEIAKKYSIKVLLNAAPAVELPENLIRSCDYFVVNEVEASFYAETELDSLEEAQRHIPALAEKYHNCWVCTMGKYGALVAGKGRAEQIPAMKTKVVETTGAGDSFVGGFSYGILQGMDEFEAGRFAAYCSAITIRNVGAQDSMPTRKQIKMEFGI